jgi:uncharacterized DUF497 family protein
MRYTWDAKKAAANLVKHGVDFLDAVRIFDGKTVEGPDERFVYGEERWIAVGLSREQEIFIVYCEEDEDSRRIISARTANHRERERYWREVER